MEKKSVKSFYVIWNPVWKEEAKKYQYAIQVEDKKLKQINNEWYLNTWKSNSIFLYLQQKIFLASCIVAFR